MVHSAINKKYKFEYNPLVYRQSVYTVKSRCYKTSYLCPSNETCCRILEHRLLQCGLKTLETRRLRGEQIEVFKTVNGYEDVDRNMFFKLKEGSRT